MFKSTLVKVWKADFRTARLDPSNYLYYPLLGLLCRGLDWLGIDGDRTWRQLALVNVGFAAVATAIVYAMVRRLTARRDIALIATFFHLGGGYFLSLAISNEDILPSYTFVLAAMAMAAPGFREPSPARVAATAAVFTLGWLIEWRLMFPTLPPLLLALALSAGPVRRRAWLIVLFLAVMVGVALLAANRWHGHDGAVGLPGLLWTGKGVDTGWGGFSLDKIVMVVGGMGEYWLGGHIFVIPVLAGAGGLEAGLSFLLEVSLLVALLILYWSQRRVPTVRTVAIVFLGNLAAGEVMNAYSQPGDPQMQINVMPWLTIAVALLLARLTGADGRPRWPVGVAAAVAALAFAYNVHAIAAYRGNDSRMEAALGELERVADPARTVFLFTGWEGLLSWQMLEWTERWEGVCDLGPAPLVMPKFKWISLFSSAIHHPEWTGEQDVAAVKAELDCAFDKGYRVVAGPVWTLSAGAFSQSMATLNARERGLALHDALHAAYRGTAIGGPTVDGASGYWEITRR